MKISINKKINKMALRLMLFIVGISLFCSCKIKEYSIGNEDSFSRFLKSKNVNIDDIRDIYEEIEYVKYVDLNKYFKEGELNSQILLYEGKIEYYDKNDNIVKIDENATEILSIKNGEIENEHVNDSGYLINGFGKYETEGGFYNFSGNYYYVSPETHRVICTSVATFSNLIKSSKKVIRREGNSLFILYLDDEKRLKPVKNQISNIEGEVYLTDEKGKIITDEGIHEVSNIYDNTFHLIYEGLDGKYRKRKNTYFHCYVDKNGKVKVGDVIDINGNKYVADLDGVLVKDYYIWNGMHLNRDMIYDGTASLDNITKKIIYYNTAKISLDSKQASEYKFSSSNIATDSNFYMFPLFLYTASPKVTTYAFKNGKLVTNDFVSEMNVKWYAGPDGKLQKNTLIDDNKKKLIVDKRGIVLSDVFLFDKYFYENEKFNNKEAPYIYENIIDREVIKPYLGYYILSTGEIFTDDILIESAIYDENNNVIKKFTIKNGEYDGKYDKNLFYLNSYEIDYEEYNYEEYDDGKFAYIHKYTSNDRKTEIDITDINMQLKYIRLASDSVSVKNKKYKDTVFFGEFYNHDEKGEILEPLEWIILDKKAGYALLTTYNIIECLPFDENGNHNWEQSSIRKWLNTYFLNTAFTYYEQDKIVEEKYFKNLNGPNDKVFLLTIEEFENYNKNNIIASKGHLKTNYANRIMVPKGTWYRNRSLDGKDGYSAMYDFIRGIVNSASEEWQGVRPAIWVKYND